MEKGAFFKNARGDLTGPLSGVKVIEATTTWAGPMVGCILGDLGAEVLKVEHPKGELSRSFRPQLPNSKLNVPHETVNRNKQNLSLDLKHPKAREIFLQLCTKADIVVENFKPGTLSKWGIGYQEVSSVKPDIIYLSISMFGQYGPLSKRPGYDPLAQNFTGWSSLNGPPSIGSTKAPTWLADDLSGLHGVIGALAALTHRNETGEGQHVDVSLVDSLLFQSNGFLTSGSLDIPLQKLGNRSAITDPVNVYKCMDGEVFVAALLQNHWKALSVLIDKKELSDLSADQRKSKRDYIDTVVADWCLNKSTERVVTELSAAGIAVTKVNTFKEAAQHAQVNNRDMLQEVKLSDGQLAPLTGPPTKFSKTPTRIRSGAPKVGAHNDEVLGALGFSGKDLIELKKEGVI